MKIDVINCVKLLSYIKARSPEIISGDELSSYLEVSKRTLRRYIDYLKDDFGIDSKKGRDGGYFFNSFKKTSFSLEGLDELNQINLSIDDEEVIKKLNKINLNGINLCLNLKFDNSEVTKSDLEKMIVLTDSIRAKKMVNFSSVTKEGRKYQAYFGPICFKIFDGVTYLYAYYRNQIRMYVLSNIEILDERNEKFIIKKEDIEYIKNKPNYELYDKDPLLYFKIKIKKIVYNRFKKEFKNEIKFDDTKQEAEVTIKTQSYLECLTHLLALQDNFQFLDKKNKMYELYKITLSKMKKNL